MLSDARHRRFDLLVVWKLDRLSRSLKDLITTLDELGHLGIDFVSYDNQLDTSSPSGKLVFNIIGAVAEFERDIIRERVRAGLANARIKGKKLGRPQIPKSDQKKIITLKKRGLSNRAIGKELRISESTVRNYTQ
jgi:DNA invertase Pin-like site-specific DNA recombinase